MKKLIIAAILIISLGACKKCADCTTTVTTKVTGQPIQTATSQTEMCGDDLEEADGNVTTSTSTVNGYTATIISSTQCE